MFLKRIEIITRSIWCFLAAILAFCNMLEDHSVTATDATALTYFCDDDALKNISHKMHVLDLATENLRLSFDNYNLRLEQLFIHQKDVLLKDITQVLFNNNLENLIDVRSNFTPSNTNKSSQNENINQVNVEAVKHMPTSCAEALHAGSPDGIYQLRLTQFDVKPFYVYCMKDPHNNGSPWTIVQRRMDGSVDFYRDWQDYKYGFGNLDGEFFLGLEQIHALTHSRLHELWIQLEDFDNVKRFVNYESFAIGDERVKYALNVLGKYRGDAGDALRGQQSQKFTTKDSDNDVWAKNCAVEFTGAWWYAACHSSNLNGQYLRGVYPKDKYAKGVTWSTWHDQYYSMKYVHMAIRPVK